MPKKAADLDTKEVTVTVTLYILNEKVFELDECPKWAKWAAVDKDGSAYWYEDEPETDGVYWTSAYECSRSKCIVDMSFDATDWQHSLIKRPEKVLGVTMADIEKKFGCKVKIVKEN